MSNGSVVVIGAGIIGLATAFYLRRGDTKVTIVDRDPAGDKASFGNAGGIAVTEVMPASVPGVMWRVPGWLLDPLGPLALRPAHVPKLLPWLWRFSKVGTPPEVARIATALAAINHRIYDDLLPLLDETNLAGELIRKGALTVYETEDGFRRDAGEWSLKRKHGIEVQDLTAAECLAMEPALSPIVRRGVFTPQWSHVTDPKRIVDGLRNWLQANGVEILTGAVAAVTPSGGDAVSIALEGGRTLSAPKAVIAAGAWSGILSKRLGDPVLMESERGYNTTIPDPGIHLDREVIFAERKFVATPLSCGLRIGGAAEFGGLDAVANYKRSAALAKLATIYLPGLKTTEGTAWAGHRPTTPDSLPVIGASPKHANIFYAFGHGHLGLTQSAPTGRLIADLIHRKPVAIDLTPYSIARFS